MDPFLQAAIEEAKLDLSEGGIRPLVAQQASGR